MKNKQVKIKIGLLSLLLVVLATGTVLAIRNRGTKTANIPGNTEAAVNFSPPTDDDKKAVEDNKSDIVANNANTSPAASSLKPVIPVISDATQYDSRVEVRSYVPGVFENGGTCTVTVSKGDQTLTKPVNGSKDATTTSCEVVLIRRSEFAIAGTWDVTVTYLSGTAKGTSAVKKLEVN